VLHYTQSYLSHKKCLLKTFHSHKKEFQLYKSIRHSEKAWMNEWKKISTSNASFIAQQHFTNEKVFSWRKEKYIINSIHVEEKLTAAFRHKNLIKNERKEEKRAEKNFYCRKLNLFISYRCTKWKTESCRHK
jgi:hypothetical protein